MTKINTDQKLIDEILTRGVDTIYPTKAALKKEMLSGKQLKLYLGVDPSGPKIHIGHTVPLRKLRAFQKLGHKIILLIGSFTATIGDPTDKMAVRKPLTKEQVLENMKEYKTYVSHILDFDDKENPVEMFFNGDWLAKLTFAEVIEIAAHFTVQRMLERDMFEKRMKEGKPVHLHEFFYPLMQGYDSVYMGVDLEIGGTDQTFNMLAGRTLMKAMKNKEKYVLTVSLVTDSRGVKIGKSEGNMIEIPGNSQELYAQIMSLSDEVIAPTFIGCSDVPLEEILEIEKDIKKERINPRDAKMRLASEIVKLYHSDKIAQNAQEAFVQTFQKKETPTDIPEVRIKKDHASALELFTLSKLVVSRSEVKRLIAQGGIKVNEKIVENESQEFAIPKEGLILQKGKRYFLRVKA